MGERAVWAGVGDVVLADAARVLAQVGAKRCRPVEIGHPFIVSATGRRVEYGHGNGTGRVSVGSTIDVFGHCRLYGERVRASARSVLRGGTKVSGRTILTSAVVALIVVIGYDQYKQRRGM